GHELRRRCGARPSPDAAGQGGVCREPDRSRNPVCALASGYGHHLGRHGVATTVRGCARGGRKRLVAAGRVRPADGAAAGIRRRITVIAEIAEGETASTWRFPLLPCAIKRRFSRPMPVAGGGRKCLFIPP